MAALDADPAVKLRTSPEGGEGAARHGRVAIGADPSMPTIYRKTAKGFAEIETRAHRLTPRVRSALIVVDGRKSDTELAILVPQAAESLAMLAEGGFIEAVVSHTPPPAPAPLMAGVTVPAALGPITAPAPFGPPTAPGGLDRPTAPAGLGPPGGAAAPAAAGAPPTLAPVSAASFEARRRMVLRAFNDAVGPPGESMAIKLEKAKTLDDLRVLLPQAIRLVEMVQGRRGAETFAARLDQI